METLARSPSTAKDSTLLDAALGLAADGWHVLPIHPISDGRCTCSRAHCSDVGKHPATRHGHLDATRDPDQIRKWWAKRPNAGVGGVPAKSYLVVLDADDSAGLQALEAELGPLPRTRTHRTGRGEHRIFSGSARTTHLAGVDVIGETGWIVLPPSPHASGAIYELIDEAPIAPLPARWAAWFAPIVAPLDILPAVRGAPRTPSWLPPVIPVGARHTTLTRLAAYWRHHGFDEVAILTALQTVKVHQPPGDEVTAAEFQAIAAWAGAKPRGTPKPRLRKRWGPVVATWTGRTAPTDARVLLDAVLPAVARAKSMTFPLSARQAAVLASVTPKTAAKALRRLQRRGVLQLFEEAQPGETAAFYLLKDSACTVSTTLSSTAPGTTRESSPANVVLTVLSRALDPPSKLLFSRVKKRLGLAAGNVYQALTDREQAHGKLQRASNVKAPRTFNDALERLRAHELAEKTDAGWKRGPATPHEVASRLGILDVGKRRKELYARERVVYEERVGKPAREKRAGRIAKVKRMVLVPVVREAAPAGELASLRVVVPARRRSGADQAWL